MTLRRRLALTLLATTLPLLLGAAWLRVEFFRRSGEQALIQIVESRLDMVGQERCEEDPGLLERPPGPGWRGRRFDRDPPGPMAKRRPGRAVGEPGADGPPLAAPPGHAGRPRWNRRPVLFAYDARFQPATASAPPLSTPLRAGLESGKSPVLSDAPAADQGRRLQVAVRTGWNDGVCAIVVGHMEMPPAPGSLFALLLPGAVLSGVLLLSVWLAAGPVVRRIHGLTAAVRRSAADRYASQVPESGSDEIAELSRAFNEAGSSIREHVVQLERRERTLRSFLANTTHDVMLPLTVLQGHLAELRRRVDAGEPVLARDVGAAMEEAQYMASLLHNLSAAAKLDADESLVDRQLLDLGALVDRVVARHRTLAGSRGVSLDHAIPEDPLYVSGDVTLLEQALGNLVHNALRYNREGGHVAVVLESRDRDQGPGFEVRVLDDGPGVPDELLPHLTERRFRGDAARTRQPGGLGLGLHIARDVAERHGFELRIGNADGGGLAVILTGPNSRPQM